MNATATKPATKKAVSKSSAKSSEKSASPPKTKAKKTTADLPKPDHETGSATTKSVAKPSKTTVKSNVPAAGRTTAEAGKAATVLKRPAKGIEPGTDSRKTSGSSMSDNNADTGLTDTMAKSVVLKASEVTTKTTTATPAASVATPLLTEEQILKMSDTDYMNEAQLAFFKDRLQQLERELLKNAGETTEHLRETVLVPDPADRATIEEEHALELRTRDRERKLLKKVQQSLVAIESGEYGWCEETGEPIGIPRLLARPTATLSLEAQQRRELKQKLYGD